MQWLLNSKTVILCGYEKGKSRIYTQNIDGGLPQPISPERVTLCARPLTPDGKYCVGCTDGKKFLVPLNGGQPRAVPTLVRGSEIIAFSPDSRFAYVQVIDSLPAQVDQLELATGELTKWRMFQTSNIPGITGISAIVLAADLKAFALSYESLTSDLYTLDGVI